MEDYETYDVNVRDAGVLFYAKVIEDYEPPTESGDDSAQQLALSEGEGAPATTWADMAWTATVAALLGCCVQLVRGLPPRRRAPPDPNP